MLESLGFLKCQLSVRIHEVAKCSGVPISPQLQRSEFRRLNLFKYDVKGPCSEKNINELKKGKQSSRVTWWIQELAIKKKDMQAIQKTANNITGTEQTKYQLLLSPKKPSTRSCPSEPNEHSWKNFYTQTKHPYGIPYKTIIKDNIPH
ncbi:hypothetical protein AVEN_124075-1 [Araneus ventricosus]|uniref:Uncharacterized protein n=1 Tax=Araneus ventricosus TaxID=182803 RepID=A0A4Y2QNU9_ARAVE|nr:hypothetical protein AVEN_124075-1 [Araneus ventricosus]